MGVFWDVRPFDDDDHRLATDLGWTIDYPRTGNRLPTLREVRTALATLKDIKVEGDPAPKDGDWTAFIDADGDSTILHLENIDTSTGAPDGKCLEKGSAELAATILAALAPFLRIPLRDQ